MFTDLFSLRGRIALVTGGSRGIGKMIASGFLSQGAAKVYITARKALPCEATAKELSSAYDGECIALPIDISTMTGIETLASEIKKGLVKPESSQIRNRARKERRVLEMGLVRNCEQMRPTGMSSRVRPNRPNCIKKAIHCTS